MSGKIPLRDPRLCSPMSLKEAEDARTSTRLSLDRLDTRICRRIINQPIIAL